MRPALVAIAIALPAVLGCDGFDPELYRSVQGAVTTSDTCDEAAVTVLQSSPEFVRVDLAPLDDSWQVANCARGLAPGNDGFFAVDLAHGQKFHFHVNALDAIDPVLYVVDDCDERVCQPLNSASSCPNDKEHLSFLAPRAGRYFVGVDSAEPGGGSVELLALSPECGDREKQHSEACDDGNAEDGDGCDSSCRIELAASGRVAQEPNDDLAGANTLALPAPPATFAVHGTLEGACDPEVFSFALPEDAVVSVRVLDTAGNPCAALHPELGVELQLFAGLTPIASGQATDDNACPVLAPQPLAAATVPGAPPWAPTTHHLRLATRGPSDAPPLAFTLELTIEAP